MIEKLKKIYRILFPKKFTELQLFENNLGNNSLILKYDVHQDLYSLKLNNNLKSHIRNPAHSDYKVFCQILNEEEYKIITSIFDHNEMSQNLVVIDAGANIGLTTFYLSQFIDNSTIFCVEPSDSNLAVLEKNIKEISNNEVVIYPNALSHLPNLYFDIENDFRDGLDWSSTTKSNIDGKIKGITIAEIIEQNELEYIDFLKIDIEGAERFIFMPENNLSYLTKTKIISIEIHDEFEVRKSINNLLMDNGFLLFQVGEITVGLNKFLL